MSNLFRVLPSGNIMVHRDDINRVHDERYSEELAYRAKEQMSFGADDEEIAEYYREA